MKKKSNMQKMHVANSDSYIIRVLKWSNLTTLKTEAGLQLNKNSIVAKFATVQSLGL
jgi:hypothetical protein